MPDWYSKNHSPNSSPLRSQSDYFQTPTSLWLSPCLNPSMACQFPFLGKIGTHILHTVYNSLYRLTPSISSASSSLHFPLHSSLIGIPFFFPKWSMLSLLPQGLCTYHSPFLDCLYLSVPPSVLSSDVTSSNEFFAVPQSSSGLLRIPCFFSLVLMSVCNCIHGYIVLWLISVSPVRL